MITFHKFEEKFNDTVYSLNKISPDIIISRHNEFLDGLIESEKIAIEMLKQTTGMSVPDDVIDIIRGKSDKMDYEYDEILKETLDHYLEEAYENARLDNGGICLKSQLIGKACQMIHNEDMLGVVREIDENNNRYLLVDFGDEAEVKIDIDELIISGQKR